MNESRAGRRFCFKISKPNIFNLLAQNTPHKTVQKLNELLRRRLLNDNFPMTAFIGANTL